jgi:hypothetical protein
MANYETLAEKGNFQNTSINVGNETIPWLNDGMKFSITIAHFPDHGRLCFVAHTLKSNPTTLELARGLTVVEREKVDDQFSLEIERILNGNDTRRAGRVLSAKGKPDIYSILIGRPFDPKGIRLYYTKQEFLGNPAIYLLAIAKDRDTGKVYRLLENAGYEGVKNWDNKRLH